MATTATYREVQRFRSATIWLILGSVAVLFWVAVLVQLGRGRPFGDRPASDRDLLIGWVVFGVGLPLLFWSLRLVTEVDATGVRVRFAPLPGRLIPWPAIAAVRVVRYRPLRDFGGWGLRWGWGRRRAYTVSGDQGVELTLCDGRRVLLGSRRPDRLHEALQHRPTTDRLE